MSTFLPAEKGVTIRQPSTANLMLDSADRDSRFPSPWDFQISKPQALLNGFFTRIGTTEVVLEWTLPNGNTLSGLGALDLSYNNTTYPVPNPFLPNVSYTVEAAITAVANALNTASGVPGEFGPQAIGSVNGIATTSQNPFQLIGGLSFLRAIGVDVIPGTSPARTPSTDILGWFTPDLRPFRYLDFVSSQLTYNQDLKDSSTSAVTRDVLCRWYFTWDSPNEVDGFGYPILMGYKPFVARRLFNPPKQIRWDNIQPLGNLAFQVYTDTNILVPYDPYMSPGNWLMTLQVSEV